MRPPDPQLRDDVVALRPWRDEDVPAKVAAFSDPETHRFSWPQLEPYTEAHGWAIHEANQRAWADGTSAEFACVAPDDDAAVIGGASVYGIDRETRTASVGYWVEAPKRRQGVAAHAVNLLARWAFDELEIIRLQLTCGPDNVASQRVAERAGSRERRCCDRTCRSRAAGATRSSSASSHRNAARSGIGASRVA